MHLFLFWSRFPLPLLSFPLSLFYTRYLPQQWETLEAFHPILSLFIAHITTSRAKDLPPVHVLHNLPPLLFLSLNCGDNVSSRILT